MMVIILIMVLYSVFSLKPIMQVFYPIYYQDTIWAEAEKYDLDPYLIAAIIRVESSWREEVVSPKGATGLMQLMPSTAEWVGTRLNLEISEQELSDPQINIMLGCWYINYLHGQFSTTVAALAAYNGGQGNVRQWISDQTWDGSFSTAGDIPFLETRSYVQKIYSTWDIYRKIYDN